MIEGFLILNNRRIEYSGSNTRVKFNHGAAGNIIRNQMGKAMGYETPQEEHVFGTSLSVVNHAFIISKKLAIRDKQGNEYELMLNVKKSEREKLAIFPQEKKSIV